MQKLFSKFAVAVAVGLALAAPTFGGGWAVVTLDELPAQVVANQPTTIGFTVRQHGQRLTSDDGATLVFRHEGGGEVRTFDAQAQRERGHFSASVKLPEAGQWRWYVDTWGMQHAMPDLTVQAASSAPMASQNEVASNAMVQWPLVAGLIGLAVLAGSAFVWLRTRARVAAGLAVAAVLVAGAGFALTMIGNANAATLARQEAEAKQRATTAQQVALGRRLFVAKGCSTCHQHDAITEGTEFYLVGVPDLTNRPLDPTYLRAWLKDPSAIKPKTEMPDLGLKLTEIEALTAFLTQ